MVAGVDSPLLVDWFGCYLTIHQFSVFSLVVGDSDARLARALATVACHVPHG